MNSHEMLNICCDLDLEHRAANPSQDLNVIKSCFKCNIWILSVMHTASYNSCVCVCVRASIQLSWKFLFSSTSFCVTWYYATGLKIQWPGECDVFTASIRVYLSLIVWQSHDYHVCIDFTLFTTRVLFKISVSCLTSQLFNPFIASYPC